MLKWSSRGDDVHLRDCPRSEIPPQVEGSICLMARVQLASRNLRVLTTPRTRRFDQSISRDPRRSC
jgi:hypothetical protein